MASKPQPTVADFLSHLPPDRRGEVERLRALIRKHLPQGYEEVVSKNMLVYQVPLSYYSGTYNGQPLWYAAIASEKSYLSLHLMNIYGDPAQAQQLKEGFRIAGKKLDMGKSCIHFRTADDLPLETIAKVISSTPMERWVAIAKGARKR